MSDEVKEPQEKESGSRDIFEDLKDWSGKFLHRVKEEADTLSTKGKLKLDITTLKSKRNSEYRKLGMKVYALLDQGKLELSEAEENIARIQGISDDISDREVKLKELGQKPEAEAEPGAAEDKKEEPA